MAVKNVTASINHKKDVYYIIVNFYVGNKRKQKWIKTDLTVSGNNKRRIENKRVEVLNEWREKLKLNDNNMLFSDYLKYWLERTKHKISENTYYSYRGTIHNVICPYFEEKGILLGDLKVSHLEDFYNYKIEKDGVTANTIYHYHANISKALNYAVEVEERLERNPAKKIELPKKQKHIANFYSAAELNKLLEYARGNQLEVVLLFAAWFGLRRGEIAGIRWKCIDFENKTLYINGTIKDKGKSGSKINNLRFEETAKNSTSIRSFSIFDSLLSFLSNLKKEQEENKKSKCYHHRWDEFVCVRKNGELIPLEYMSRKIPELTVKAGLPRLKLHELRHTNITLLLESGASLRETSDWAGHSTTATTANIYAHVRNESKIRLTNKLEKVLCEKAV